MKNFLFFTAACSLIIFSGISIVISSTDKKIITLEGDVWPPYVLDPSTGANGFIVDVAIAALAKSGYEIKYSNIPWTRALQDTIDGKTDGAVGIYFSDAKDRKFIVPAEEIGISINKFYVRKGSSWLYRGLPSLKNITLGIIDGYDYGEINKYLDVQKKADSKKIEVMFGDKALENNIHKLLAGRIDVTIEDQLVMSIVSLKMGVRDKIKEAGTSKPSNKVGIAFSTKNPMSAEYAKALSSGIVKLRASGELKRILDRYGVKDWK